jgi:hypothetical protein
MAPKPKSEKFASLFELQESMEVVTAESAFEAKGLRNTIKRQPLCAEAMAILENLDCATGKLLELIHNYRKDLAELAEQGGHHAS